MSKNSISEHENDDFQNFRAENCNFSTEKCVRQGSKAKKSKFSASSSLTRRGTQRGCNRSKSTRRGGNIGTISSLSFSQKQALTVSWKVLRAQSNAVFRKILLELEIASPKVKQIFYKAALVDAFNKEEENRATLDAHLRLIAKFFDDVLAGLDDEEECVRKMRQIGQVHAVLNRSCSFSSDIWERLGEIAMERVCTHESVQKTREASRAWRTFIAILIDEIRGGFDGELRAQRKSSSTDQIDSSVKTREAEEDDLKLKLQQLRMDFDNTVPYS